MREGSKVISTIVKRSCTLERAFLPVGAKHRYTVRRVPVPAVGEQRL